MTVYQVFDLLKLISRKVRLAEKLRVESTFSASFLYATRYILRPVFPIWEFRLWLWSEFVQMRPLFWGRLRTQPEIREIEISNQIIHSISYYRRNGGFYYIAKFRIIEISETLTWFNLWYSWRISACCLLSKTTATPFLPLW